MPSLQWQEEMKIHTWACECAIGATVLELLSATEELSGHANNYNHSPIIRFQFIYQLSRQKDNASQTSHRQSFSCKRWGAP